MILLQSKKSAPSSRGERSRRSQSCLRNTSHTSIQKILLGARLRRHVRETNDPEDPDGFSPELKMFLVGFPQCFVCWFLLVPFSLNAVSVFSGNRHGASSWTTRFSPRTVFLKMTDFPERADVVTANFGSFFRCGLSCAMVNFVLFPSCNLLGLSSRDFFQLPGGLPCTCFCLVV